MKIIASALKKNFQRPNLKSDGMWSCWEGKMIRQLRFSTSTKQRHSWSAVRQWRNKLGVSEEISCLSVKKSAVCQWRNDISWVSVMISDVCQWWYQLFVVKKSAVCQCRNQMCFSEEFSTKKSKVSLNQLYWWSNHLYKSQGVQS